MGYSRVGYPGVGYSAVGYSGVGYPGVGYSRVGYPGVGYSGVGYPGVGYSGVGYSGSGLHRAFEHDHQINRSPLTKTTYASCRSSRAGHTGHNCPLTDRVNSMWVLVVLDGRPRCR